MANSLYDLGREKFLTGVIDVAGDDIRLILVDEDDDAPNLATDEFLEDRAAGARVATSGAFASKTTTNGTFDAADVTLSTVTGDPSESIDIYQHTGNEATAAMIANIDTATGLPVTPNGGDIVIQFDSGSDRIFTL